MHKEYNSAIVNDWKKVGVAVDPLFWLHIVEYETHFIQLNNYAEQQISFLIKKGFRFSNAVPVKDDNMLI